MPRLIHPSRMTSRPLSVALGELGIAAGLSGQSVTFWLGDHSDSLICEIWKYYQRVLGRSKVMQVHATPDIKNLRDDVHELRAVLVHSPRLFDRIAWTIQTESTPPLTQPAVFCTFSAKTHDEIPGPTLALTCDSREKAAIENWLLTQQEYVSHVEVAIPHGVHCHPQIDVVFQPTMIGDCSLTFSQLNTFHTMMIGAAILRSAQDDTEESAAVEVGSEDYDLIRSLLCASVVKPNGAFVDPLTLQIIQRANVYLAVKYNNDTSGMNSFRRQPPGQRVNGNGADVNNSSPGAR